MNFGDIFTGAFAGAVGDQATVNTLRQKHLDEKANLDAFKESQYNILAQKMAAIENDPNMSQEQKRQGILGIRQQQFKLMTPRLAKKRLAEFQQKYGLTDQGPGTVPAEKPLQVGGMTLPGRGEYSVPRPGGPDINDILASGQTQSNEYALLDKKLADLGWDPEHRKIAIEAQLGMYKPPTEGHLSDYGRYLASYAAGLGLDVNQLSPEQQIDARTKYNSARLQVGEDFVPDPDSPTKFSKVSYDKITGRVLSKQQNALPPRGWGGRLIISKDPFGNETVTVSTPTLGGQPVGGATSTPTATPTPATPQASPQRPPQKVAGPPNPGATTPPAATTPGQLRGKLSGAEQAQSPLPLDANGEIPKQAGMNEYIRQSANDLIAGRDIKDIDKRAKQKAEELATKYGWSRQGFLSPKEKLLVNEASAKLQQLYDSPSLAVLDDPWSAYKISQAMKDPRGSGPIGDASRVAFSHNLNPQEAEFLRLFNAASSVIAGLTPLTRGGRPTEASIGRLMKEMPDVLQSSSSADGKARLQQFLQEIKVASQMTGRTPLAGTTQQQQQPTAEPEIVVSPEDLH